MDLKGAGMQPWYSDWQFWSFVAAGIAIVLSQLPPMRLWLKRRKLEVEVHNTIVVNHDVGRPIVQLYVMVRNNGGRKVRIDSMSLTIRRDEDNLASLNAMGYFETTSSKDAMLLVPFNLLPDEGWSHSVNFFNVMNREEERVYRGEQSALRSEIHRLLDEAKTNGQELKEAVTADEKFVTPFVDRFKQEFIWRPGEYVVNLTVNTAHKAERFVGNYKFVLFESDRDDLQKHVEAYARGFGVIFPSDQLRPIFLRVSRS